MMTVVNTPVRNNGRATANRARANRTASDRLGAQAKKVTEDIQELGGIAGEAAQEKLGQLRETASDRYEEGREKVQQVERTFEQYVQEHPVKSLLIAAGVGLVLGRFWMRR
jgi:ElaB/YqjD/DUF883 family membrane-anchored ribosome-binding protein